MTTMRIATGDAWLAAHHAVKVLKRLRAVAPELVAAAEAEVEMGVQEP